MESTSIQCFPTIPMAMFYKYVKFAEGKNNNNCSRDSNSNC